MPALPYQNPFRVCVDGQTRIIARLACRLTCRARDPDLLAFCLGHYVSRIDAHPRIMAGRRSISNRTLRFWWCLFSILINPINAVDTAYPSAFPACAKQGRISGPRCNHSYSRSTRSWVRRSCPTVPYLSVMMEGLSPSRLSKPKHMFTAFKDRLFPGLRGVGRIGRVSSPEW